MSWPARSHGAGDVTEADVGKEITVCGWVDRNRNLGGLGFMDIRDHTGLLQVGTSDCVFTRVCAVLWGDGALWHSRSHGAGDVGDSLQDVGKQ